METEGLLMHVQTVKILVVEDSPTVVDYLKSALEFIDFPHSLSETDTVDEALDICKKSPPDLILCDVRLNGDKNGLEFVREYRLLNQSAIMTAYGSRDVAEAALKAGANDYIEKPIEFKQLKSRIENALLKIGSRDINASCEESHAEKYVIPPSTCDGSET
jgi:DNA-binding response OmpR family regulator